MSSEEWSVVTKDDKRRVARSGRRRGKQSPQKYSQLVDDNASNGSWTKEAKDKALEKIAECEEQFQRTDFHKNFMTEWESKVAVTDEDNPANVWSHVDEIVCYGIGNFSILDSSAMWQLACALCIRKFLNEVQRNKSGEESPQQSLRQSGIEMTFFDPCTTDMEAKILEELQMKNLNKNERGKHFVNTNTLFFMIHCPKQLYGNLLWSNWNALDKILILGNSLCTYHERSFGSEEQEINLLIDFIYEKLIPCSKQDIEKFSETAFNDSFLTWFDCKSTKSLPSRPPEFIVPKDGMVGELL
mmetsp:Transcript_6731/g.10233  ORF Transcript_6731/g.10233 Transcript_6731/m.10233 type:complete len:300 (-) Transcript_6731:42-941(-)